MRFSVLLPFVPRRPEQVLPFAALVKWTAAERLWQGQAMVVEPFQSFAYAAGAGFRIPTGLAVTLMPLRHPFQAAQLTQSLALTTGEPVTAGFGPGARAFQKTLLGAPYASPLTATREYLTIVRSLLAGDVTDVDGEYFSCRGGLHHVPTPPIDLGLGVLRPGMARLAGEVADRAITWLTPAPYLRDVVTPALADGAAAAGRDTPSLAALVPVALRRRRRDPVDLVVGGSGAHLRGPHYQDMLRRAGIPVSDAATREDAQLLIDGGAFLYGDLDDLSAGFAGFADAGVDEIILNLTGVCAALGGDEAMADLKVILAKLG